MIKYFRNLKIFHKLLCFNIIFTLGMCVNIYISFYSTKTAIIEQKKEKLRNFVESATSYMDQIYKDCDSGNIDEKQVKDRIFEYIQSSRFDHGNYFWIHDLDGKMVLHPVQKKLNSTDVNDLHDSNNVYIFKEFNRIVNDRNEGYLEYLWPKPGENQPISKISFVRKFEHFKWVIGSGMYLDNVNSDVWQESRYDLFMAILISILFQIIVIFLSRSISSPFANIEQTIQKLIDGNQNIVIKENTNNDEIGMIYRSLKKLHETFIKNARLKSSLDCLHLPLILTDENDKILYNNKAMDNLYEKYKKQLFDPLFSSTTLENVLVDKNINDINSLFKISLLNNVQEIQTSISTDDCSINVVANPVLNVNGAKIGTIIQLQDITHETIMQKQIENTISEIANGNLSIRLDSYKMSGFFKDLSDDINEFIDQIDRSISDIARSMKALSLGNLTKHITNDYNGTLDAVKQDTNSAISELENIMLRIVKASKDLLIASGNIHHDSQELSERTEHQASSLEETAASMEELASTVRQTSEHAVNANRLASKAKSLATEGGAIVQDTVVAMQSIEESFKKIDSIMLVMDEIAFQTNLLALNAAVEAARAGESGKGFAVVAEEVRALAQRSSQASKQIKNFMEESAENVKNGVFCVHNTGERLDEIVEASKDVATLIAEIASASEEQTSGLEQVNIAVSEMDHMTQANAALVEKSSASADSLNQQADDLMNLMNFFTFNQKIEDLKKEPEKEDDDEEELKDIDLDLSTFKIEEESESQEVETPDKFEKKNLTPTDDPDWKDF